MLVSRRLRSLILVNLVIKAVVIPMEAPMARLPKKMVKKLKIVQRNAPTWKESGSPSTMRAV